MSKLSDRIRRASRTAPAPIGFGAAAARAPEPTLLCVVRLSSNESGKAGDAASRGADAVIVDGIDAGKVKDFLEKAAGLPVGVRLQRGGRKEVAALKDAGADFVALDTAAPAEAMLENGIGFVLALGRENDDTGLRMVGDLSLDALVVPPLDGSLTLGRLLELRRVAALARTPMLTEVAADAGASHLQALRESGIIGVIVDSSAMGRLEGLRQTIASLPPRGRRKEERAEPLLPAQVMAGHGEEEEEDEQGRTRTVHSLTLT
jgi:hypothetical protein